MPRQARHVASGLAHHLTHRGVNRQTCFGDDADRLTYIGLMEEMGTLATCHVHAFALMPNHVHILATPMHEKGLALFMKRIAQAYSQRFNRKYQRTGPVWEGRYKSSAIEDEAYLMRCYRYIELNPVRAGLVGDAGAYPWSSFAANGRGMSSWTVAHPLYSALGSTPEERAMRYREFVEEGVESSELLEIRAAIRTGNRLGVSRAGVAVQGVGTSRGTSPG